LCRIVCHDETLDPEATGREERLVEHNEIVPAVNQIETHPFFQRTADQELMHERDIQIESWGPFAEGRNNLFSNPLLSEIGAAHGKSVGQVVLRCG
jgi:2,5-diketo-D-gluconate reductase A